jgi:hypothetical protein
MTHIQTNRPRAPVEPDEDREGPYDRLPPAARLWHRAVIASLLLPVVFGEPLVLFAMLCKCDPANPGLQPAEAGALLAPISLLLPIALCGLAATCRQNLVRWLRAAHRTTAVITGSLAAIAGVLGVSSAGTAADLWAGLPGFFGPICLVVVTLMGLAAFSAVMVLRTLPVGEGSDE